MTLTFDHWKQRLLESAGTASQSVRHLGDYVLELFWKDGCEPTMQAMLDYAQAGLCQHLDIRVSGADRASSYNPRDSPNSETRHSGW